MHESKEPKTERILPAEGETTTVDTAAEHASPMTSGATAVDLYDQYTIYGKIGSGGMGIVYLARDKRLDRFVAVKRLNRKAQASPVLRKRFLQEARAVAALNHVHIVHIYALGEDSDGPYIVMEYVAGPDADASRSENDATADKPNQPLTLEQYIANHGSLDTDSAVDLMIKISSAIAYSHGCGVIHRDIKPGNILLDTTNEPKIVDFGLARMMHSDADISKLTVQGEKLLSIGYGAPEQEKDANLSDERSDIYSLGGLLYFALTGRNPRYFREQDVPVVLRAVLVKALATEKEQRWPTAASFVEALRQVQNRTRVETPTVKTTWRCKWCDAVNPLTTSFCAECGWDGRETCPECGSGTFVGMQYCSGCGADLRQYESVGQLLEKMRLATTDGRLERVVSYAGHVHGFEPAGPAGRQLLKEITTAREDAEKKISRRNHLREIIPIELNSENFERAQRFISEYRELAEDKREYEIELSEIPARIVKRDLARIRRSVSQRDWNTAERICISVEQIDPQNAEVQKIRASIRTRRTLRKTFKATLTFMTLAALYLFTTPFILRLAEKPLSTVARISFTPLTHFYERGGTHLARYFDFATGTKDALKTLFPPNDRPLLAADAPDALPEDIRAKRADYEQRLKGIFAERDSVRASWLSEYQRELDALRTSFRESGDYESWKKVDGEYKALTSTAEDDYKPGANSGIPGLELLIQKYRQLGREQSRLFNRRLITLGKEYVNTLSDILKDDMRNGKMDEAAVINDEIKRLREDKIQREAESALAMLEASGDTPTAASGFADPAGQVFNLADARQVDGIEEARKELAQALAKNTDETSSAATKRQQTYLKNLSILAERFQREGAYDNLLAVQGETARFNTERTLEEKDILPGPADLAAAQRAAIADARAGDRRLAQQVVEATEKCEKRLAALRKKLTSENKMDQAATVNAEIKRILTGMEYLAAKHTLDPKADVADQLIFSLTNSPSSKR